GPVGLDGQDGAGLDRLAVHHDRAGATRRGVAAAIGPGEPERLSKEIDQEQARLDLSLASDAVYGKSDAPQGPPPSPSTGSGSQGTLPRPAPGPAERSADNGRTCCTIASARSLENAGFSGGAMLAGRPTEGSACATCSTRSRAGGPKATGSPWPP